MHPLLKVIKAPSLVLATLLLATACATAPARPPVQVGSGDPRVDPVTGGPQSGPDSGIEVGEIDPLESTQSSSAADAVTPSFMADRDITRAAVLLPFSHPNSRVRSEAEAMLAGIELALFEYAGDDFLIIPKDTAGKPSVAEARADEARSEGADIVLGPLFGANVKPVREVLNKENIPVIAFSNDRSAAGGGAYLSSVLPEEEVRRVVQYAASKGVQYYAFLGPNSDYGRQVEAAMRFEASRTGGEIIGSRFYDLSNGASNEAREIAKIVKSASARAPGRVAVMIPERGISLLSVAPLLPYNGVDLRRIKLLGTSLWNDKSVWREPTLQGGLFASTDPEIKEAFIADYRRIYGRAPSELASSAYDAAALSILLADDDNLRYNGVTNPDGFMGVNGLFRFRIDGTAERGLAVSAIRETGPEVVEKGPVEFSPGGS